MPTQTNESMKSSRWELDPQDLLNSSQFTIFKRYNLLSNHSLSLQVITLYTDQQNKSMMICVNY